MSEEKKAYIRCVLLGSLISAAVWALGHSRGFPPLHCASDGFFAAFVFLAGAGGIRFVANRGFFDVAVYGTAKLFALHHSKEKRNEDFLLWREKKQQQRKPAVPLVASGSLFLLLSVLTLLINH